MTKQPRLTLPTMKVLKLFLDKPREEFAGTDISKETKLKSGTLYPILLRLEDAGWLKSRWEELPPQKLGKPRRRFYQITGIGQRAALEAMQELGMDVGGAQWSY